LLNGRHAVLCVATACDQRADLITLFEGAARWRGAYDLACDLKARNVRGPGWRRVVALALKYIWPIDTGSSHFNEYLARARRWHRALTHHQHLRATRLLNLDDTHDYCSPLKIALLWPMQARQQQSGAPGKATTI
jgi:hypothetical protein